MIVGVIVTCCGTKGANGVRQPSRSTGVPDNSSEAKRVRVGNSLMMWTAGNRSVPSGRLGRILQCASSLSSASRFKERVRGRDACLLGFGLRIVWALLLT